MSTKRFFRWPQSIREWRRRARSRAELMRLDDAILRDIGICRGATDVKRRAF